MDVNTTAENTTDIQTGYRELLRNNVNFRYLLSGHIISLLGDWFNLIATSTLIAQLTGSGTAIGALFVVRMIAPFIVSPFTGVAADRFNRKHLLVLSDILRAITVLGFLIVNEADEVWLLYVLTFIQLALSGLFFPTRNSILPDIVSKHELGAAIALGSATWSMMLALGAALGGIVAGYWGIYTAFVVDSATFILSAILLSRIEYVSELKKHPAAKVIKNSLNEYVDGLKYLKKHPDILFIALNKAAIYLFSFGGFQVIQVRIAEEIFVIGEGGSTGLGWMFAVAGIGTGIGPIIARRYIGDKENMLRFSIVIGYLIIIAGMLIIAPLLNFNSVLAGILIRGVGGGIVWVFSTQLLLQLLPGDFRGRVFSTEFAIFTLMSAVSAALVGGIMDMEISLTELMLGMTFIGLIPTLLWTLWSYSSAKGQ